MNKIHKPVSCNNGLGLVGFHIFGGSQIKEIGKKRVLLYIHRIVFLSTEIFRRLQGEVNEVNGPKVVTVREFIEACDDRIMLNLKYTYR